MKCEIIITLETIKVEITQLGKTNIFLPDLKHKDIKTLKLSTSMRAAKNSSLKAELRIISSHEIIL